MFAERRRGDRWEKVGAEFPSEYKEGEKTDEPYEGRNYRLFGFLADVRNGSGFGGIDTGDAVKPIAMPRGVPDDASPEYKEIVDEWDSDGHSHSWLTLKELREADWDTTLTLRGIVPGEVYDYLKDIEENPKSWSGDISGHGVQVVEEEEWQKMPWPIRQNGMRNGLRWYVRMQWHEKMRDLASDFLDKTIPMLGLLGEDEDVRVVFFFDN
jgi:hypothetical protein